MTKNGEKFQPQDYFSSERDRITLTKLMKHPVYNTKFIQGIQSSELHYSSSQYYFQIGVGQL